MKTLLLPGCSFVWLALAAPCQETEPAKKPETKKAAVGELVPDYQFQLVGCDGRRKLSELHGQPVLIVNWNSGALLSRCLQSLSLQRRAPDRVVLVDNASTDGSLEQAAAWLGAARVIRLDKNVGFARGNNIAAAAASDADAFALLNPDAFAEPGWLAALVSAAERHPDVAAFASQMRLDAAPDLLDGAGDSYHVSGRAWRNAHRLLGEELS